MVLRLDVYTDLTTIPAMLRKPEYAKIDVEIIFDPTVEDNGDGNLLGFICSKDFLISYKNLNVISQTRNEEDGYTNHFLKLQKTLYTRPFEAIKYIMKDTTPQEKTLKELVKDIANDTDELNKKIIDVNITNNPVPVNQV
jgi:hypothetical protein